MSSQRRAGRIRPHERDTNDTVEILGAGEVQEEEQDAFADAFAGALTDGLFNEAQQRQQRRDDALAVEQELD